MITAWALPCGSRRPEPCCGRPVRPAAKVRPAKIRPATLPELRASDVDARGGRLRIRHRLAAKWPHPASTGVLLLGAGEKVGRPDLRFHSLRHTGDRLVAGASGLQCGYPGVMRPEVAPLSA